MADLRDDDATLPGGVPAAGLNRTPETDPEHLLPEHAGRGTPGSIAAAESPDLVRDEIERTRARMSSTIGSIEDALLRKKEQIHQKLDVLTPVRDRPLMFAGGVFGAGLLLGFITGGRGDDDADTVRVPRSMLAGLDVEGGGYRGGVDANVWRTQAQQWEGRARELMQTCARHEEEIRSLREGRGGYDVEAGYEGGGAYDAGAGYEAGVRYDAGASYQTRTGYLASDGYDSGLGHDVDGGYGFDAHAEHDHEHHHHYEDDDDGDSGVGRLVALGVGALVTGLLARLGVAAVQNRGGGETEAVVELEPRGGYAADVLRQTDEGLVRERAGYVDHYERGDVELDAGLEGRPGPGYTSPPLM